MENQPVKKSHARRDVMILLVVWNIALTIALGVVFVMGLDKIETLQNSNDAFHQVTEDHSQRIFDLEEEVDGDIFTETDETTEEVDSELDFEQVEDEETEQE